MSAPLAGSTGWRVAATVALVGAVVLVLPWFLALLLAAQFGVMFGLIQVSRGAAGAVGAAILLRHQDRGAWPKLAGWAVAGIAVAGTVPLLPWGSGTREAAALAADSWTDFAWQAAFGALALWTGPVWTRRWGGPLLASCFATTRVQALGELAATGADASALAVDPFATWVIPMAIGAAAVACLVGAGAALASALSWLEGRTVERWPAVLACAAAAALNALTSLRGD